MSLGVNAFYYNGRDARQYAVSLSVRDGKLSVNGEGLFREEVLGSLIISEKLGSAPRIVRFQDGAHCEVTDQQGLDVLLEDAGVQPISLISRFEAHWRIAIIAVVIMVSTAVVGYFWGLPFLAEQVAKSVPLSVSAAMDVQTLKLLDEELFEPSKLPEDRMGRIRSLAGGLREAWPLPEYTLEFRNSPIIGPNAFAMPGGTIVVTDELVELTANDEEVVAVVAHEIGHLHENHALRQLLQGSAVALFMAWYFADLGNLAVGAPTLVLQTRYSRDFEHAADVYGAALLRANGLSPSRLADMLEKLQAKVENGKEKSTGNSRKLSVYFATHPATAERILELRKPEI